MCEDARGGQQPLFLRGKQEFLSFFHPASVKCACKQWIPSEPRLLQTQVTPDHICLKNTPKYTFCRHTTKSSMFAPPPPLFEPPRYLAADFQFAYESHRLSAISRSFEWISVNQRRRRIGRVNEVYRRQPGWKALERNLYRHFSAIWSFFYTRILITKYFSRESLRWRAEIPSSQRFLQLYCASH